MCTDYSVNGVPVVFFWKDTEENGYLSNWYQRRFIIDDFEYLFVEQYMMAQKAKLFHDAVRYTAILRADKQWECKNLGKKVTPFDAETWDAVKYDIVKEGNRAKFEQNPDLKEKLLKTGDAILAEASPKDMIWGVGLDAEAAASVGMAEWPGQGLLGRALMELREEFREELQEETEDLTGDMRAEDDDYINSPMDCFMQRIKRKPQSEILREIQSLKRDIFLRKKFLEEYSLDPDRMYEDMLNTLKFNRECLEYAVRAYKENGGVYTLSDSERKSRDFDAMLNSVQKLVLSIGGYFGGFETRTYTVSGDTVETDVRYSGFYKLREIADMKPFTKDEFISGLRKIHIGEWDNEYENNNVMDGTQWNLEIYFEGQEEPFEFSGSNAFPYNFTDLTEFLGMEEDDDEEEDGDIAGFEDYEEAVTDEDEPGRGADEPDDETVERQESNEIVPVPYTFAELPDSDMPAYLYVSAGNKAEIANRAAEVIRKEAPILKDALIRRVTASFGVSKMPVILKATEKALKTLRVRTTKRKGAVYYWGMDQDPETYNGLRVSNERPGNEICPQEIRNAIIYVLRMKGELSKETLVKEVSKVFGYKRLGKNLEAALLDGVQYAKSSGAIMFLHGDKCKLS